MQYKIKSKLWIEVNGKILLGEGRIQLLKAVQETGSLSAAAKSLSMSYKKAWKLMDAVNKGAKQPLLITSTGGAGGGGAELTPYGKQLITVFEEIKSGCWTHLDAQQNKLNKL